MRALSLIRTRVDLLTDVHEVAEISKFATKFAYEMHLRPSDENSMHEAILTRTGETFLRNDLAHLVYLTAMADGQSVSKVLQDVATLLETKHHVDLDTAPADQPGIGDRHPDGHH